MMHEPNAIPMMLDNTSWNLLVFGGGKVATRKAEYFRGMAMTVISPCVSQELIAWANTILKGKAEDNLHLIEDHDIIIAATDDKPLNDIIVDAARSHRKMVNSAHGGGNFMIPSVLRRDGYSLFASTGGLAPVWAPHVLRMVDSLLPEEADSMCQLLIRLREECRLIVADTTTRTNFLTAILEDEAIWGALRSQGLEDAVILARRLMEEYS